MLQHIRGAYSRLADRLGRCAAGSGAKPCTLQVPHVLQQIRSCRSTASVFSVEEVVCQDKAETESQDAEGD